MGGIVPGGSGKRWLAGGPQRCSTVGELLLPLPPDTEGMTLGRDD